MNYLVVWSDLAFERMADIVGAMPARRAEFAATLKAIASGLRTDPLAEGESRADDDRIWFVGDLIVSYIVDEESRTVEIASIRLLTRRAP